MWTQQTSSVAIYQLFDCWSTKYLSEIVEGCSLIPTIFSSFFLNIQRQQEKKTFDFKNVKLHTEIVQWL